jgi:hypothetical protein
VYRIYRELELNLRIKPKKRLVREPPEPLAVPEQINTTWPMDFMHDRRGHRSTISNSNTYNRESHSKTPTSSVTTAPYDTTG